MSFLLLVLGTKHSPTAAASSLCISSSLMIFRGFLWAIWFENKFFLFHFQIKRLKVLFSSKVAQREKQKVANLRPRAVSTPPSLFPSCFPVCFSFCLRIINEEANKSSFFGLAFWFIFPIRDSQKGWNCQRDQHSNSAAPRGPLVTCRRKWNTLQLQPFQLQQKMKTTSKSKQLSNFEN